MATSYTKLQWGHVFVDVEMGCEARAAAKDDQLQWGHVFVDVEMGLCCRPMRPAA